MGLAMALFRFLVRKATSLEANSRRIFGLCLCILGTRAYLMTSDDQYHESKIIQLGNIPSSHLIRRNLSAQN
jgi:hypothetical protein